MRIKAIVKDNDACWTVSCGCRSCDFVWMLSMNTLEDLTVKKWACCSLTMKGTKHMPEVIAVARSSEHEKMIGICFFKEENKKRDTSERRAGGEGQGKTLAECMHRQTTGQQGLSVGKVTLIDWDGSTKGEDSRRRKAKSAEGGMITHSFIAWLGYQGKKLRVLQFYRGSDCALHMKNWVRLHYPATDYEGLQGTD